VSNSSLFCGATLLTARQYFNRQNSIEEQIRSTITTLWETIEWDWYRKSANIENYRSGLLWRLFMSNPEIPAMLDNAGFVSDSQQSAVGSRQ
jgi:hypothetical protein